MEEGDVSMERRLLGEDGDGDLDSGNGSFTSVLIVSLSTAACGALVTGSTVAYTSPVQSAIIADLGLTTADYSLFGAALSIGGILGAFFCGKLSDRIGRRATMRLADVLYISGWLSIAFSRSAWSLDLGRLLMGLGTSLLDFVTLVYIAEVTPKSIRGGSSLVCQVTYACGLTLIYLVGLITSWRTLALIGVIPCLVQFLGVFLIPESPRWLVMLGRNKDSEAALQRLRGKHADISLESVAIKEHHKITAKNTPEGKFLDVLQVKYAYALTVTLGLMALAAFGGTSAIFYYATAIFEAAGFSTTIGTIAMALIQIPPTAAGALLMDKFGRRPLLLFSAGGMGTACLSLAVSFVLKQHGLFVGFSPYLALIGIVIFCISFSGMGGIPFVILSEMFPVSIKGEAGSLAIVVSYTSGCIVTYSFNFLMNWSTSGTFFIFTSVNVLSVLFIAKLVPETKGRTLEEIQESLAHRLH